MSVAFSLTPISLMLVYGTTPPHKVNRDYRGSCRLLDGDREKVCRVVVVV